MASVILISLRLTYVEHFLQSFPRQSWIKSSQLAICGRAVLEIIVNYGKAHRDEWSRQRAIALTMRVGGCPPLTFISWEVLRTDGNQFWKEWTVGALASENGWRLIRQMEGRGGNQGHGPVARK